MNEFKSASRVVEAYSLEAFFHQAVDTAIDNRKLEVSEDTKAYVSSLLVRFSRSERFFNWHQQQPTNQPLALIYGEAVHARSVQERIRSLRRLGDIALFIAGMFAPSLERKVVGLDYYVNMGGSAYDWLSEQLSRQQRHQLSPELFSELAACFEQIVEALDDLAEGSSLRGNRSLISLYEKWLRTKDPAISRQLDDRGIKVSAICSRTLH